MARRKSVLRTVLFAITVRSRFASTSEAASSRTFAIVAIVRLAREKSAALRSQPIGLQVVTVAPAKDALSGYN
jgi:hypothetical protein